MFFQIKTADNRVLQEKLQEKATANKQLEEIIEKLRSQIAILTEEKSIESEKKTKSCVKCRDFEICMENQRSEGKQSINNHETSDYNFLNETCFQESISKLVLQPQVLSVISISHLSNHTCFLAKV